MASHNPDGNTGRIAKSRNRTTRSITGLLRCLTIPLAIFTFMGMTGCLEENEECVEHIGWGTEGKYYYYTGECTAVSPAPQGAEQAMPIYEFRIHFDDSYLSHFGKE